MNIVLNADDFGLSSDTVDATIACFEAGHLTSATIMVGMPETARALEWAQSHPEASYGVHLQFVGDGEERPLSPPAQIPDLVDKEGRFLPTNVMRLRGLLHNVPVDQIAREIIAQVEHVQSNGVTVTHVDSHRHLHKFPPFKAALQRVLPGLGIQRVRNVQDVYLQRPLTSPTYWLGHWWRRSLVRSFITTDHFYMPTSAGDDGWHRVVGVLPPGRSLEVGLHPGFEEPWRAAERSSLAPFVETARDAGYRLVSWSAIGD
jgi:chitin disaccharide deacetylase